MLKWILNWLRKPDPVPKDGFAAFEAGYGLDDNPFPKHTPSHSIWRDDMLFLMGRFR